MDTKIFLQGFNSKTSSNTSEGLDVQFKGRRRLLPLNDVADVISQYDQYMEEREKCNIIRLTCQVNPICSNVLFNHVSEIVHNEGHSGVTFLNYGIYGTDEEGRTYTDETLFRGVMYKPNQDGAMQFWSGNTLNYLGHTSHNYDSNMTIFSAIDTTSNNYTPDYTLTNATMHPTNAIRDMQLSNGTTSFIYHCGMDVFNSHLIRSNTFKTICRMPRDFNPSAYTRDYQGFNTITDLMRDVSGNKVIEKVYFPVDAPVENHSRLIALHTYSYDDIDTFKVCSQNKLIRKYNGWLGFENRSKIKSYIDFQNDEELEIERPLMYMNGGDFVDMYPGRDLYSFIPRYNRFKQRIEKNWNYCLTYPSSSYTPSDDYSPFSEIIESERSNEHPNGLNSLKAVYFDENTRADNGTTQLVIYSVAKHGLSKGDYVNIYKTYRTYNYWVVDTEGNRVSDKFKSLREANDELTRLEIEGQISFECGEDTLISASRVVSSQTEVAYNEKIIDNAEVSEVVDDYIFIVFNSNVQISNNWVFLERDVLRGLRPLTISADGVTRIFNIDDSRKFLRENGNGDIYYIVNDSYVNIDENSQNISYKKVVNDIECDYYIRIFSRLPNFKFASGDTSSEYEIYRRLNNNVNISDIGVGDTMLSIYQGREYDFENHVSRLAFAKNIYTDDIGEIVFTDDIDISNLHDNLGRPLTSIYITFIKNNMGYKEWYGYDYSNDTPWDISDISGNTVEFSHAFGKITCGIKTSDESNYGTENNSINRITNISNSSQPNLTPMGFAIDGILNNADDDNPREYATENGKRITIDENEIWYNTDKHFYGDLCYYDGYNAIEKHIDYIMHRFNTEQRESNNAQSMEYFRHYVVDEIHRDDYDTSDEFQVIARENEYDCNNFREGYYYIPHYEIPIKTFDKLQTIMPDFLTIREIRHLPNLGENTYSITTLQQHFLSVGDKAMVYDSVQDKYYNLITISGDSDNYRVFTCNVFDELTNEPAQITYLNGNDEEAVIEIISTQNKISGVELNYYKLFKMDNLDCPSYAKVLKDGTCRIIWRNVLNNGFNKTDKSVEEYPFTNGAFYINQRVDIYVRRQDPRGLYGLYSEHDVEGEMLDMVQEDNYVKNTDITC